VWGERVGVPVIAHQTGADPGAVAFDAVSAAISRGTDVVIVDTAGRLHTKHNLMQELEKVRRVIQRQVPSAPHEVLLVIDATTGQNGLQQARIFAAAVQVTHLALAKLDGTAKGGIAFAITHELGLPIAYVGTGEQLNDLADFDADRFVEALLA
jgi:fused signal recognition particle receptor